LASWELAIAPPPAMTMIAAAAASGATQTGGRLVQPERRHRVLRDHGGGDTGRGADLVR
jgi:hypothetical protein